MPLTELPFGFPGRIFRSPMPFGQYDLHGEVYDRFCEEQISVIVLLASDEECLHKTSCNLRALYPMFKGSEYPCRIFGLRALHTTRSRGPKRHRPADDEVGHQRAAR